MENKKKVKTFRISETTEYMLRRLSEYQKISEGKTLEKLIQKEYEWLFPKYDEKKEKELIKIANTPWVEKY